MLESGLKFTTRGVEGRPQEEFTLRRLLAHGGQGYVYVVENQGGDPAVLKVPAPSGLLGAEIERRILEKLPGHKNVITLRGVADIQGVTCPVFDFAHPNPWVRLGSSSVRNELARHSWSSEARVALPAPTAIEMVQEVCAALEHVHTHGFVHGDIKPQNVLVLLDTQRTRLSNKLYFQAIQKRAYTTVVVDFGSARGIDFLEENDPAARDVVPSEFTPVFAPPEVFDLDDPRSGPAVDVYQVGLLLYQLLTGHTPYDHRLPRPSLMALSTELVALKKSEQVGGVRPCDPEAIRATGTDDVMFAETYQSQKLRDRFYDDVVALIDRATDPDPGQRPSISELRGEMLRLFELEPPRKGVKRAEAQVSVWNPRWHLRRTNRLARAAMAPDGPQVQVRAGPSADPDATTRQAGEAARLGALPTQDLARAEQTTEFGVGGSTGPGRGDDASSRSLLDTIRVDEAQGEQPPAQPERPPPAQQQPELSRSGSLPRPRPAQRLSGAGRVPSETRLPRPQSKPAETRPAVSDGPLAGVRVALIDDDKVALAVLGSSLRKRGCRVGTFRDPELAMEVIGRDHPDALLIDLNMPRLSGLELIRTLTRRLGGVPFPILVLSSVEKEEALQDAFRVGVRDYLVKPVAEAELAVKLEQALDRGDAPAAAEVPYELGGFELLEVHKKGEVAVVYRAVDAAWADSSASGEAAGPCSVKVLRPDLVGEAEPLLRLRREINLLTRVARPGLPSLLKSGLVGGLLYYVSERLPERTLGEEVREGYDLDERDLVDVLSDVGGALEALHADGVLVGTLTPEVMGKSPAGRVQLIDLLDARWLVGPEREDEPPLTKSRYAPPERYAEPVGIDLSGDVYSLGACALELFARAPAVRDRGKGRIDVPKLAGGLPRRLEELLAAMTEPTPERRISSAELVEALRELR